MEVHYVYLLKEREFIKTGESVYKVGKTKQKDMRRFDQYPKGSILELYMRCQDCDILEKELLKVFRERYQERKDIGREYFAGNQRDMIYTIYETMKNLDCKDYIIPDPMIDVLKELEDPNGVCPFPIFYDYYMSRTDEVITKTICSIRLAKLGYRPEKINSKPYKYIKGIRNPSDANAEMPALEDIFSIVCRELRDESAMVAFSVLYDHYKSLCTDQPMSKIACSKRLNDEGYESVQMRYNGKTCKVIKGLKCPV